MLATTAAAAFQYEYKEAKWNTCTHAPQQARSPRCPFFEWRCPRCSFFEFGGVRGVLCSLLEVLRGVLRGVPFQVWRCPRWPLLEFRGVRGVLLLSLEVLRGVLRGVPFLSLEVSEVFRFRIWRCPEVCFFEFGSVRGARSRVWRCPRCASRCPFSSLEVSEVPIFELGGV